MRKSPILKVEQNRIAGEPGDLNGAALFRRGGVDVRVIFSDGLGWDHVSVSLSVPRCPTWDEMCWVKSIFFEDEEEAIQIHPPRSKYVTTHEYCLHLWRPQSAKVPMPHVMMV